MTRAWRWIRRPLAAGVALIALLLAAGLARNYVHAETRGTVPLGRLARQGSGLERSLALAVLDSMPSESYTARGWHARRERSANGDTLRLRLYRSQDARFPGRALRPEPHVVGGAFYVVSERRIVVKGVAIR